ncbi:MAG: tetratricopeptide repeat protein [Mailhella sp.]|nr:tetratricopeptide repeat protein [Mailhella sp.]
MKDRYTDINEYIHDLQEEIAKDPKCAIHHYNLGVAMLSLGDFTEAEECFLNAVRQSPHLAEAFIQLGGLCQRRGDLEGCLQYNKEAAEARAKFPEPWNNIGFVYLQQGEIDKAIGALQKALTWNPRFVQARSNLASALFQKGEYEKCIETCNMVIREYPDFAPAWNNLSLAAFELGDLEKAYDAALKAYEFGFDVADEYWKELKAAREKAQA